MEICFLQAPAGRPPGTANANLQEHKPVARMAKALITGKGWTWPGWPKAVAGRSRRSVAMQAQAQELEVRTVATDWQTTGIASKCCSNRPRWIAAVQDYTAA